MKTDFHSPIELLSDFVDSQTPFYADPPAYRDRLPETLRNSQQFELLHNRLKLREFCRDHKIHSPDFIASEKFDRLTAWAVKKNRFPLAIKTAVNLSDGEASYSLKAFRELPEFYENIAGRYPGTILLEDFLTPKARIEVTWLNSTIRLISQVSLDKSMQLRHHWRAFPLKLPAAVLDRINEIAGHFSGLIAVKDIPIRFSFALDQSKPTLLTINSGMNRPEYLPAWTRAAGLPDILSATTQLQSERICKLLFFYGFSGGDFDQDLLMKTCSGSLTHWGAAGDQIMVLLSAENATTLLEDAKRVDALFKHLRD